MPQLDDLLAKALQKEPKKAFTRRNRPDRIASEYLPKSHFESEKSEAKLEPTTENTIKLRTKLGQTEDKVETQPRTKLGLKNSIYLKLRTKLRHNLGQVLLVVRLSGIFLKALKQFQKCAAESK